MDILKKVLLFLGLFLLLAVPNYAIPHFENEYITPKYASSLYGQYYYKDLSGAVDWYWATPSFENNGGYYDIFDYGETVTFEITINTSLTGDLYLGIVHQNQTGDYEVSYYLVKASSSYNNLRVSKDVQLPNTWHGATYYYWTLYSGGNYYYSNIYHFFIKGSILEDWQYRRILTVTTTKSMKNGTFEFEINDSDFYSNSKTFYVSDDCDYCLSGTTTDIVITNTDLTKAYPYFINKYKGGYYEYNQNSSNSTLIDVWVNEDATTKNLYVYYGFERLPDDATASLFGMNDGHTLDWQSDEPNNPFTLHQIFSDYRWSEDFFKDFHNTSYVGTYYRGDKLKVQTSSISFYLLENSVTKTYFEFDLNGCPDEYMGTCGNIEFSYNSTNLIAKYSGYPGSYPNDQFYFRIYNESNNYSQYTYPYGENYLFLPTYLEFNGTHRIIYNEYNDKQANISATSNIKIYKIKINSPSYYAMGTYYLPVYFYNYYELPDITNTFDVGNQSLNDYAIVNFESMYEYSTFINDLWIGGIISTDSKGTIICYDMDNNVLGSIKTPETSTVQSYEITFPYTISNQTDFLNRNDFNYTCKFVSDLGYEEYSDNLTITFEDNRIYLSSILPDTQENYTSQYVATQIQSELNYTNTTTDFYVRIYQVNCLKTNEDGECLDYDFNYKVLDYNDTNISSTYLYDEIQTLNKGNWYVINYKYCRDGECKSTATRIFYVAEEEEIELPPEEYIDWNDTNITENKEFMDKMFWGNPLNYLSSFVYQNYVVPNCDSTVQTIFLYVFTVFWNFLFILLMIAVSVYMRVQNLTLTAGVVLAVAIFFSYLGWISISVTTLLILSIVGVVLYLKKRGE